MRDFGRLSSAGRASSLSLRLALACGLTLTTAVFADGGVTFTNIAAEGGAGIAYERVPSERNEIEQEIIQRGLGNGEPISIADFFGAIRQDLAPLKARGAPGVVIFDYDSDNDLDIYATNGPGGTNTLYSNQFQETGDVTFVDMSAAAGVGLEDFDNSGACFGDIDNDGDPDLFVLATVGTNTLFENQGDGTFTNRAADSGTGTSGSNPTGCGMADFNMDGYLDIVVGNTYDSWSHRKPFRSGPNYEMLQHTELFMNNGNGTFNEVAEAAGLHNNFNMDGPDETGAGHTWALAAYDHDDDGDVDILLADNQYGAATNDDERRGFLRFFDNDGTGNFTEGTTSNGMEEFVGAWMGLTIADFNCDTYMDVFATDTGYTGFAPTTWFFRTADGHYVDGGPGDLIMTPFGWGASALDYDNDGDSDVIYHGSIDLLSLVIADNPGALLQNSGNCSGAFTYDSTAVLQDHVSRLTEGVAVGDLDNDGFEDIVTASSYNVRPFLFFNYIGFLLGPTGSPFDPRTMVEFYWNTQSDPVSFVGELDEDGNVIPQPNGDLTVEMNSGGNGNRWFSVDTQGSYGLIPDGKVNRDGIGAVVSVRTPQLGQASRQPVLGGASYQSQDSLLVNVGIGTDRRGLVEVAWPGGVRNRLYSARSRERLVFPEIPCSFADQGPFFGYLQCVDHQIDELVDAGVLTGGQGFRYFASATRAYFDYRAGR